MIRKLSFALLFIISFHLTVSAQTEKQKVLKVVDTFFKALEDQDTLAFKGVFLDDSYNFYVSERNGKINVGGRSPHKVSFNKNRVIKERLIEEKTEVMIHKRIAMVWAPYNLWINKDFSHCGVDVFTLIKKEEGWKISSLSYTVEPEGCDQE
ncbi:hypothetical protein GWK08_02095 [Leptobacterium flavescens]|uniref:Nuclear transport factor 2 family protein n=1 Tax=Leptobacterium flavescens TaxID=472055 RepID=A0A6P0UHY0_9FLAO|nr:nuclear transport factor 2 family protein [Leptobacterium flavescens]NER12222.1 hypothetical protein [Leptobacterium flavescens]